MIIQREKRNSQKDFTTERRYSFDKKNSTLRRKVKKGKRK